MLKDKFKASGIHFVVSLIVIIGFLSLVYFIWFTPAFFFELGALKPLKILILVDIVIGPILTFLVYKKGKKTLKLDLTVIVLLQLAALAYGAYSTYLGRPSIIYLDEKSYRIAIEKEIEPGQITNPDLISSPFTKPRMGLIETGLLSQYATPSKKVGKIIPLTEEHKKLVTDRQITDPAAIVRLTQLEPEEYQKILQQKGLNENEIFTHMVYIGDIFHLLITDKKTYKPLALISDKVLKKTK